MLENFPNLEYLNCENNPLSAKNLENLTSEQCEKLTNGLKSRQIRISANQGTIFADLLEYTQRLIKNGDNSQKRQAYQLATVIQNNSSVKNEKEPNKPNYTPLIISGVLLVGSALVIGYLLGKKRKISNP